MKCSFKAIYSTTQNYSYQLLFLYSTSDVHKQATTLKNTKSRKLKMLEY